VQAGSLAVPADGPVSWTTQGDLAEAAAIALTEAGRLDGLTPPLTAAEALTFDDVAAILLEITGREITRSVIADEEFKSALISYGTPETQAAFSRTIFAAVRAGNFAGSRLRYRSKRSALPASCRRERSSRSAAYWRRCSFTGSQS
jgi:uncharacterized protein YbjT (DUF2867 family)